MGCAPWTATRLADRSSDQGVSAVPYVVETLLVLATTVVMALLLMETSGMGTVALRSLALIVAIPALALSLCLIAHRWRFHCLHMSVYAVLLGSIGVLLGARLDFGQFALMAIADLCRVQQNLSLETIRAQVASAPWTCTGMLGGCNLGMALSMRSFDRAMAMRATFVPHYISCNAGMTLGMYLTDTLTLWDEEGRYSGYELRRMATELCWELKKDHDIAETTVIGGQKRQLRVILDPVKLQSYRVSPARILETLQRANVKLPSGSFPAANREYIVETGGFLKDVDDVGQVLVATAGGKPVYLKELAGIIDGPEEVSNYVFMGSGQAAHEDRHGLYEAVTVAIAKKKGTNATHLADGDYFYNVARDTSTANANLPNSALTGPASLQGFVIRRVFFTYDNDFAEHFAMRFRLEFDQTANSNGDYAILANGNGSVYIKDAWLRWKNVFAESDLYFGIQPTSAYDVSEGLWSYRSLEKTIMDLRGIVSSRHLGICSVDSSIKRVSSAIARQSRTRTAARNPKT